MRIGIQQKLGAVVLILVIISLSIVSLSYVSLGRLHDVGETAANYFIEFTTVDQLHHEIDDETEQIKLFLLSDSGNNYREFTQRKKEVRKLLKKLEDDPTLHGKEKIYLHEIDNRQDKIEVLAGHVFAVEETMNPSKKTDADRKIDMYLKEIKNIVGNWRELDTVEVKESLLATQQFHSIERQLLISSLAILAIGLLLAWSVAQFITKPLLALHKGVDHIDKGGLEYVPNINTHDEIQDLAEAFGRLVQNLRREEQTGAEIQRRLLPQKKLRAHGVSVFAQQAPARVVGGDWYDYYRHEDEIRILIADASGKGIPGALLATVGMTAIRSEPKLTATIKEILTKANHTVTKRFGGADFITLFSAELSLKDNCLHYINCGHEPPLYFNAKDDVWDILPCLAGFPMGISLDIFDPTQQTLALNPGDKILLYTDGVHSVRDKNSKFFSLAQITEWLNDHRGLSVKILMDELLAKVVEYNDGPLSDDVTLLGIEMTQTHEENFEDGETSEKTTA